MDTVSTGNVGVNKLLSFKQWKRIFKEQIKDAIPLKQPIGICKKCGEYDQSTEECYQVRCIKECE